MHLPVRRWRGCRWRLLRHWCGAYPHD